MSKKITDRAKAPMETIVKSALATYDYRALYRAKIVSQSSDKKKVDVKPLDPDFPGVTAELALMAPKVTIDIPAGTQCLLTWDGGDPRKPIALLFFAAAGTKEVARKGDAVDAGTLAGTVLVAAVTVPVQFTYIPAGGGSPVGPGASAALSSGKITEGSSQIKID